ncbi:MAG: hypothetical protein V3S16_15945 [Candidatus Desulfatibia sp.]
MTNILIVYGIDFQNRRQSYILMRQQQFYCLSVSAFKTLVLKRKTAGANIDHLYLFSTEFKDYGSICGRGDPVG